MKLTLYAAPSTEPIDLTTAKAHLRVDSTAENDLITALIVAARQSVETRLRRALVTQTWDLSLDRWTHRGRDHRGYQGGCDYPWPGITPGSHDAIELPLPALQSITSIAYVDTAGTTQTLASSAYQVTTGTPGRVAPAYGTFWPDVRCQLAPIAIRFVAGYGAASAVPACVKQAMLLLIGHWFEQREAVAVNVGANIMVMPEAVDALLAPEQYGSYS